MSCIAIPLVEDSLFSTGLSNGSPHHDRKILHHQISGTFTFECCLGLLVPYDIDIVSKVHMTSEEWIQAWIPHSSIGDGFVNKKGCPNNCKLNSSKFNGLTTDFGHYQYIVLYRFRFTPNIFLNFSHHLWKALACSSTGRYMKIPKRPTNNVLQSLLVAFVQELPSNGGHFRFQNLISFKICFPQICRMKYGLWSLFVPQSISCFVALRPQRHVGQRRQTWGQAAGGLWKIILGKHWIWLMISIPSWFPYP